MKHCGPVKDRSKGAQYAVEITVPRCPFQTPYFCGQQEKSQGKGIQQRVPVCRDSPEGCGRARLVTGNLSFFRCEMYTMCVSKAMRITRSSPTIHIAITGGDVRLTEGMTWSSPLPTRYRPVPRPKGPRTRLNRGRSISQLSTRTAWYLSPLASSPALNPSLPVCGGT